MFAIRDERDYVVQDDLMKAVRKVAETKKLETKMDCTYIQLLVFASYECSCLINLLTMLFH